MRNVKQIIFAVVVLLSMVLTPLTALPIEAATSGTGYTKASDVQYVTSGSYIANWGARDEDCVFLSKYAVSFYAQNSSYSYDYLSSLAGGTSQSNAPSSALYQALKSMMSAEHTHKTSYDETRNQYKYTDCEENNTSKISTFYTGKEVSSAWDGGTTWNREHCWPKSKSQNGKSSDAMTDIMMLRPANASTNSSRGNKAYGESGGTSYYDPNSLGQDVRGDAARIVLYEYVRWGETSYMWGSSGVMESLNVLLKWMQEDPVDTWEMGRNDAVEAITGTRNVFVDYPEFAWLLFGQSAPKTYVTPSGEASDGTAVPGTGSGTVTPDPDPEPTPEDPAPNSTLTIAEALALGESYAHNTTTSGKYYVTGVVESISNTTYGNMTIKDASGNSIYIYGTFDATGANRFDAMANKPAVGDTITVYGVVGNYNGPQLKNAWITSITAGSGSVTPDPDPTPTPSGSASIDFSVAGNRESWDANGQVWKSNGITVTNEKGASTSNVADYTAPARFYKNSTLIVSYTGMTAIVFHVNSGKPVADFTASLDAAGATYTVNGSTVTVTFASAVNEFSVVLSAGQVRLDSLEVVGGGSGSVTPDPDPDPDPTPDPSNKTVADALAAAAGSTFTVTGTVTEINGLWDAKYGNMNVTISDGTGSIALYRLSVEVNVGDKITVTGTLEDKNGTNRFAQGCTAVIVEDVAAPTPAGKVTITEAVTKVDGTEVTVVGTVTEITTPWDSNYNNMTVVISDGTKSLTVYRMPVNAQVGDKVEVTGILCTHNGNKQIAQGNTATIVPDDAPHTHEWSAWVITKNATCSAEGVKTRTCACGESETESIPATGNHKWGEWVETKAPTTTAVGEETRTCSTCNKTQTREIPALVPSDCEHQWGEWTETKAPTEAEAGEESRTCSLCGETQTREIPKLDHTHSFGEWAVTTPATCKDEGVKTRTCACGESETQTIPVSETHTWGEWVETKAPTLEAAGEESHTCSVCQKTETREVAKLEPCDHTWGGWEVTKAPTTEEAGEVTHTCTKCGESETREVAPLTPDAPTTPVEPEDGCGAPSVSNAAMIALAAACFFVFRKRLFAR